MSHIFYTLVTILLLLLINVRVEALRLPNAALLKHHYEANKNHNAFTQTKSALKSASFDLTQDFTSTVLCTGLSSGLIYVLTKLAKEEIIDTKLCRKLIHTLAAPAFVVFWPLYSSATIESKLMASSLAFLQLVRLVLAGLKQKNLSKSSMVEVGNLASTKTVDIPPSTASKQDNEFNLADAISRSGDRSEALGGPVIYTAVLLISILCFFRLINIDMTL